MSLRHVNRVCKRSEGDHASPRLGGRQAGRDGRLYQCVERKNSPLDDFLASRILTDLLIIMAAITFFMSVSILAFGIFALNSLHSSISLGNLETFCPFP